MIFFILLISFLLFILDYWAKEYSLKNLKYNKKKFFLKGFFIVCYLENRGIAFNIFNNKKKFIILSNILLLSFLLYLIFYETYFRVYLLLIFIGGFGNLFDRIKRGYVIDYFTLKFKKCPVFNLSDIYIILGFIMSSIY